MPSDQLIPDELKPPPRNILAVGETHLMSHSESEIRAIGGQ